MNNSKRFLIVLLSALILFALHRQASLLNYLLAQSNIDDEYYYLDSPKTMITSETNHQTNDEEKREYDTSSSSSSIMEAKKEEDPAIRNWAYAFVVGGCSSRNPEYRGFIYNIAVASQILQESGSKADIVALIQMSASTNETALPNTELRLLEAMNVKVKYIPKFSSMTHEVFYSLMLEKFRILQMTEYSRIIFMDGDVMPLCSLDYLFELSEPESGKAILKDNIVISYSSQPAHGGFFMLHPSNDDYDKVQKIIHQTEKRALDLPPNEYWDEIEGWGHKIIPPDRWRSSMRKYSSTNWTWHGVHADQGLLYHWTKYVKQSVTLIIEREIENWSGQNGTAALESIVSKKLLNEASCSKRSNAPYTDFKHFTGRAKPWQQNHSHYRTPQEISQKSIDKVTMEKALSFAIESANMNGGKIDEKTLRETLEQSFSYSQMNTRRAPIYEKKSKTTLSVDEYTYVTWFNAFDKVEKKTGITLHLEPYLGKNMAKKPPVGTYPKFWERIKHIKKKAKNNWNPYER